MAMYIQEQSVMPIADWTYETFEKNGFFYCNIICYFTIVNNFLSKAEYTTRLSILPFSPVADQINWIINQILNSTQKENI